MLLSLVLGLELSLRTHLKSLALALKVESLALKIESLLALILNISLLIFILPLCSAAEVQQLLCFSIALVRHCDSDSCNNVWWSSLLLWILVTCNLSFYISSSRFNPSKVWFLALKAESLALALKPESLALKVESLALRVKSLLTSLEVSCRRHKGKNLRWYYFGNNKTQWSLTLDEGIITRIRLLSLHACTDSRTTAVHGY